MTTKEAQDMLIALAHCTIPKLLCADCPLHKEDLVELCEWTDEQIIEAVKVLKGGEG